MASPWPAVDYEAWSATCDTLHAHTQVLGKLSVALAPPEPQLQHAALRLTARGWETSPLPAPDGSGAIALSLDLHAHEAVAEHSDGRAGRVALAPDRPVGEVTREVLAALRALAGDVRIDPRPQEVPWSVPLDEDTEHATYDAAQVGAYFAAATRAAQVLAAFRAPYRGRATPVNAWWGSFDLAVNLFSGEPADPPSPDFIMRNAMDSQEVAVGWWPGTGAPARRLLRLRASRARGVRRSRAVSGRRPLGAAAGRVPPGMGGRAHGRRPARRGARFRALGLPPRLRGLRLGPRADGQRGGPATAGGLSAAAPQGAASPRRSRTTARISSSTEGASAISRPRWLGESTSRRSAVVAVTVAMRV